MLLFLFHCVLSFAIYMLKENKEVACERMHMQNYINSEPVQIEWIIFDITIYFPYKDYNVISSGTQMLETTEKKRNYDYNSLQSKTFLFGKDMRTF